MTLKKHTAFRLGAFGVFLLANLVAVFASLTTINLFLPPAIQDAYNRLVNEEDFWTWFFTVYAFPVISLVIALYIAPVIRFLKTGGEASPLVRRRLLNSPVTLSLLGILGWVMSVVPIQIRLVLASETYPWDIAPWVMRFYGLWMVNIFIITYYLFDYLCRGWYIPWVFADGRLEAHRGSLRLSIRVRHIIFWFTIFLFPAMLFLLYMETIQPGSAFSFGPGGILFGVLALVTLVLTFLVSRSWEASLREMAGAVEEIRRGDLDRKVTLRSSDEMGVLAEGLNTMAQDLKKSEKLKDTFGRIVDPRVRDYLMNHALELGGRTMEAAVLFVDIRGFTSFSESRAPEEVVAFLNGFFQEITPVIEAHGGYVNKYLGDALMAVFGAPLPLENPRRSALEAVQALRRTLDAFNEGRGEPVRIGMGLQAGPVTAGNLGSRQRMEFTVIGDTVNTASRLEALAKDRGLDLVTTWETLDGAGLSPLGTDLGSASVRGRKEPLRLAGLKVL